VGYDSKLPFAPRGNASKEGYEKEPKVQLSSRHVTISTTVCRGIVVLGQLSPFKGFIAFLNLRLRARGASEIERFR